MSFISVQKFRNIACCIIILKSKSTEEGHTRWVTLFDKTQHPKISQPKLRSNRIKGFDIRATATVYTGTRLFNWIQTKVTLNTQCGKASSILSGLLDQMVFSVFESMCPQVWCWNNFQRQISSCYQCLRWDT